MTTVRACTTELAARAIPADLKDYLGPGHVDPIGRGGSGALVLRHSGGGGTTFVKYVPHRTDVVDGHESWILLAKAEQVRLIHELAPALRPAVPTVVVNELASGCVLTSPMVVGRSPMEVLLRGDPRAFGAILRRLLSNVGEHGYCRRSSLAVSTDNAYTGRAERRMSYLADSGNGVGTIEHPLLARGELSAIANLVSTVASQRGLLPARLYFPVHGDLNLFNVIEAADDGRLVMVDQRGVLEDWDPLYDVAKMLLSVWIQGGLENGLFHVAVKGAPSTVGLEVSCPAREAVLFSQGIHQLKTAVSSWAFGAELERCVDRRWLRVLFAAAVHAVCEAACRVSVAKSGLCADPAREVLKSLAYLDFGRRLLLSLQSRETPHLPGPRPVS